MCPNTSHMSMKHSEHVLKKIIKKFDTQSDVTCQTHGHACPCFVRHEHGHNTYLGVSMLLGSQNIKSLKITHEISNSKSLSRFFVCLMKTKVIAQYDFRGNCLLWQGHNYSSILVATTLLTVSKGI